VPFFLFLLFVFCFCFLFLFLFFIFILKILRSLAAIFNQKSGLCPRLPPYGGQRPAVASLVAMATPIEQPLCGCGV
jgi:hypothetical protein